MYYVHSLLNRALHVIFLFRDKNFNFVYFEIKFSMGPKHMFEIKSIIFSWLGHYLILDVVITLFLYKVTHFQN